MMRVCCDCGADVSKRHHLTMRCLSCAPRAMRADEYGYSYVVHMMGTAIPTAPEYARDIVAELHAVVEEVTGHKVEKQQRPRMGFLP